MDGLYGTINDGQSAVVPARSCSTLLRWYWYSGKIAGDSARAYHALANCVTTANDEIWGRRLLRAALRNLQEDEDGRDKLFLNEAEFLHCTKYSVYSVLLIIKYRNARGKSGKIRNLEHYSRRSGITQQVSCKKSSPKYHPVLSFDAKNHLPNQQW